jgi:hypothetical protein
MGNYKLLNIRNIDSITCRTDAISEKDIQFIGTLPHLKTFHLTAGNLSNSLADAIGENLNNVSTLWFGKLTLTPREWRGISKLTKVSELWLQYTNIPDESFEEGVAIAPIALNIFGVQISEAGLKKLIKTNKLEKVFLYSTNVSDDLTSFFDRCPKLERIFIDDANIQCQFVEKMQHTAALQLLDLSHTHINDEILASVSRFPNLEILEINGYNITEKSVPLFRALSERIDSLRLKNNDVERDYLFIHQKGVHPQVIEEYLSKPENGSSKSQLEI